MPGGSPSTFQSAMADILGRLGQTMSLPDADIAFVTQLQTVIAGRLKQGGGGPPGGPPGAGPGGSPGAPPGLQMPGAPTGQGQGSQQPPMMGGLSSGLNPMAQGASSNPDEMRRMIQQMTG